MQLSVYVILCLPNVMIDLDHDDDKTEEIGAIQIAAKTGDNNQNDRVRATESKKYIYYRSVAQ